MYGTSVPLRTCDRCERAASASAASIFGRGRRKLRISGLPCLEPEVARAGLADDSLTTHQAAVAAALETVARDRAARGAAEAVLVGHLMASGGRESLDSERPLVVGG